MEAHGDRVRGKGRKLEHGQFQLDQRKRKQNFIKTEQIAQKSCEIFISGDIKSLSVQSSEQLSLVQPALSRVLDQMTSEYPFQPKLFYHSVIDFCIKELVKGPL